MLLFWLGIIALFVVLPYWIMRLGCDILQIGRGNRPLRLMIFCLVAWLTWDWFQLDPVFWHSRSRWPDGHANNQIIAFLCALFFVRYLWILLRGWRIRIAADITAERASEQEKERAYGSLRRSG